MLNSLKNYALRKAYALAKKKGACCPDCQAKISLPSRMPAEGLDAEFSCVSCGWDGVITDLFRSKDTKRVVTERPIKSKIKVGMRPEGQTWEIPATKKLNFFWIFSVFWLAITSVVSGAFAYTIFFGDGLDSEGQEMSPYWMLFFIPFWLIGLGMLYAAIWGSFGSTLIMKSRNLITVRKTLFWMQKDRSLDLSNVRSVELDTAYTKNDDPVYEVQIKANEGKDLKFGSGLSDGEKSWMMHEMSKVCKVKSNKPLSLQNNEEISDSLVEVGDLEEFSGGGLSIRKLGNGSDFSIEVVNKFAKWLLIGSIPAIGVGCVFLLSGIDDLADINFTDGLFNIVFGLFSAMGFLAGVFGLGVGVILLVVALNMWGTSHYFEFTETEMSWSKRKSDRTLKSESYLRSSFTGVKVKKSGHVNDDPRYEVRLLGAKQKRICYFVDEEAANELRMWLSSWLNSDESETQKSQDLGYGDTIKL